MKYKCGLIRDLLPLYTDKVCSPETEQAVSEHLQECSECKKIYDILSEPDCSYPEAADLTDQQNADALRKMNKKLKKVKTTLIVTAIAIAAVPFLIITAIIGFLAFDIVKGPEVFSDSPSLYTYCIDEEKDGQYFLNEENRIIFPEKITEEMTVKEFSYMHYNPFDPQIITYLTVQYSDADYEKEIKRLEAVPENSCQGIYSVSGAPEGYKIAALYSDDYYGFVYAITPEQEDNTVTYAAIMFCNYFLDVKVQKYIPEKYILKDFNAKSSNPYRKEMLKKDRDEIQ